MNRAAISLLAALALRGAFAAFELLAPPQFGDPTRMRAYSVSNTLDIATAFFNDDRATNFTAIIWVRWTPRANYPADSNFLPFLMANVSADSGRATREGGDALPDLQSHRYDVPLTLSGGTWAETCLSDYACPSSLSNSWKYGCFVVNIETDTALTLNVAGTERTVYALPEMQVFNIMGSSVSRAVSIAAASQSASVRFGIAENPIVQFVGCQSDATSDTGTLSDPTLGGIASSEWRMFVFRGGIAAGTLSTDMCAYNATTRMLNAQTCSQSLWRPRTTFARNARIRFMVASAMGISHDGVPDVFTAYAFRVYRGRLSDAVVERMRDLDAAELARRGM